MWVSASASGRRYGGNPSVVVCGAALEIEHVGKTERKTKLNCPPVCWSCNGVNDLSPLVGCRRSRCKSESSPVYQPCYSASPIESRTYPIGDVCRQTNAIGQYWKTKVDERKSHSGPTSRNPRWQKKGGWDVFEAAGVTPVYCGEGGRESALSYARQLGCFVGYNLWNT